MSIQENTGNLTSDTREYSSDQFQAVCDQLTIDQLRFVTARMNVSTDKEAALAIGVEPRTISEWKRAGVPIDQAVRLLVNDGLVLSRSILRRSVAEAAAVKRAGLYSDDEKTRQAAASEILDRELGRATQRNEVAGSIVLISDNDPGPFGYVE